ncbi:MAG: exosortase/archaeosortase family protein [Kiritimatiellaeota bacterium]|nr:exosortase/archaeosortase family protein [Kiritimatiellota bacterium]
MTDGKHIRRGDTVALLVSGGVTLAVCWLTRTLADAVIVPLFCRAPAEVAARYYNAALEKPGLVFAVHGTVFEVARSCAATDFFSMVTGLLTYLCMSKRSAAFAIAVLPLAWCVTIAANTMRLIFLVPATAWIHHALPEKAYAASHQAIGTLIFLTSFIILWEGVRHAIRH